MESGVIHNVLAVVGCGEVVQVAQVGEVVVVLLGLTTSSTSG